MFRRSAPSSQPDLFSSFESHFKGRKQAQLNDPSYIIVEDARD